MLFPWSNWDSNNFIMSIDYATLGLSLEKGNIAEGGSALIHKCLATHESRHKIPFGEHVAIKEYKSTILTGSDQLERIQQEGDIGTTLSHPNVVKIYGVEIPNNGSPPLLFMEWIEGPTLAKWAKDLRKNTPWWKIKKIALDIIEGI
jgi:serine/threonine protein kinase